jgi:hypothetical protein
VVIGANPKDIGPAWFISSSRQWCHQPNKRSDAKQAHASPRLIESAFLANNDQHSGTGPRFHAKNQTWKGALLLNAALNVGDI